MFRRRVFYNLDSGELLHGSMAEGNLKPDYPPRQEAERLGLENWGVIAWDEPDETIEA